MSADFDEATLAQIASGYLAPRVCVKIEPDEGPLGFIDDVGAFVLDDGVTYNGTGKVGVVSAIPGTADFASGNVTVALSAIDADVVNDFLTLSWHLRPATVAIRLFDFTLTNLFASPLVSFNGIMDKATRSGGAGKPAALTLSIEDSLRRSTITGLSVRTDGDQRMRNATDGIFENVNSAGTTAVYWGMRRGRQRGAQNPWPLTSFGQRSKI